MPNHVRNKLIFKGNPERIKSLLNAYTTIEPAHARVAYDNTRGYFNNNAHTYGWWDEENKIFKQHNLPDVDHIPEGFEPDVIEENMVFPDFEKVIPMPDDIYRGDLSFEDQQRTQGRNWYDWSCTNWGTKWNSYNHDQGCDGENIIYYFDTAWAAPMPIINEIFKNYSDLYIYYAYADEDTGSNCGRIILENNKLNICVPESGSKLAYEIAFELRPSLHEDYELVNDNYKCVDDDDDIYEPESNNDKNNEGN